MAKQINSPTGSQAEKAVKNRRFVAEMKAKLARQRGLPPPEEEELPEEFETADDLPSHLHWIWQAFAVLSRTRLVNQTGPQPITLLELASYCSFESIYDESERRELLHHVTLLDIEWLRDSHAKINAKHEEHKKEMEKKSKQRNRGRR